MNMKRIKTLRFFAAAAILAACSCADAKQPSGGNGDGATEGVTVQDAGHGIKLTTIRDDDGAKRMPNKLFYGDNDSEKVERLSPEGSVESSISCYVIETKGKKILFDTGNGAARGGKLLDRMKAVGITPGDIDMLIITHFHMDHIGGMVQDGKAMFTNAEVYVPEKEYGAWQAMSGAGAKTVMETMGAYGGRLHRFGYQDALPCGIKAMPAPGHTPGHTVYQVGKVLIVGDLMHGFDLQIQDLSICPDYDMDKEEAVKSRKKYVDYARKNKLIVAGMHFPGNGVKTSL